MFILLYIFLCLLVAMGYSDSKWGYGGGFLFCLLLSPLIGFIVMFFVPGKVDNSFQNQLLLNQQQLMQQQLMQQQANQSTPRRDLAEDLTKLKRLMDEGILTQDEYDAQKKKLLEQ